MRLIDADLLIEAITKCGETKIYPSALIELIRRADPVDVPKVAYICDGRACGKNCTSYNYACHVTTNIEHAKNFTLIGDTYRETVNEYE